MVQLERVDDILGLSGDVLRKGELCWRCEVQVPADCVLQNLCEIQSPSCTSLM